MWGKVPETIDEYMDLWLTARNNTDDLIESWKKWIEDKHRSSCQKVITNE